PPLPAFVTEAGRYAPPEAPPATRPEAPAVRPEGVPPPLPEAPLEAAAPPAAQPPPVRAEPPPLPPEPVTAPISDTAQEGVNGLPQEQRDTAQKAFTRDDRDPLANEQRRRGQPVTKRRSKPNAPEKATKLVADASKYGVFDKTPMQVLQNFASDPKLPRWIRAIADLFLQIGLTE